MLSETPFQTAVKLAAKRIRHQASLMNRDPAWVANLMFSMRPDDQSEAAEVIRAACSAIILTEMN